LKKFKGGKSLNYVFTTSYVCTSTNIFLDKVINVFNILHLVSDKPKNTINISIFQYFNI